MPRAQAISSRLGEYCGDSGVVAGFRICHRRQHGDGVAEEAGGSGVHHPGDGVGGGAAGWQADVADAGAAGGTSGRVAAPGDAFQVDGQNVRHLHAGITRPGVHRRQGVGDRGARHREGPQASTPTRIAASGSS